MPHGKGSPSCLLMKTFALSVVVDLCCIICCGSRRQPYIHMGQSVGPECIPKMRQDEHQEIKFRNSKNASRIHLHTCFLKESKFILHKN